MEQNPIRAYKGFDKSLCCRGFQYEVGKEYEHPGEVRACQSGFHACENPFDVFSYYPPCDDNGCQRRYCEVEQSGTLDQSENDKVCSSRLRVIAEIGLDRIIKAGVKFILDKVNWKDKKESNTGNRSAATNTGDQHGRLVGGESGGHRVHRNRHGTRQQGQGCAGVLACTHRTRQRVAHPRSQGRQGGRRYGQAGQVVCTGERRSR